MTVSRLWLLATIPVTIGALLLIVRLAGELARISRESVTASLPIVEEQHLTIGAAGEYALYVEGRLAERGLQKLAFSFRPELGGAELPLTAVLVRTNRTTLDGVVRLELYRVQIPGPGTYGLRITGMEPERDYSHNKVVVARPVRGALLPRILGIVFLGMLSILGIVGSGLIIATRR